MIAEECGSAAFVDFTGCDTHCEAIKHPVIGGEHIAIDCQKGNSGHDCRALVAIHKSMVASQPEDIGRSNVGVVRLAVNNLVLCPT